MQVYGGSPYTNPKDHPMEQKHKMEAYECISHIIALLQEFENGTPEEEIIEDIKKVIDDYHS